MTFVNTTVDAASLVLTSLRDESPVTRLAQLRATLLGGRGPGASDEEVTGHTRDRPWLGSLPAPVERALVERQTGHVRAGEPITNGRVVRRGHLPSLQAAVLGAVVALAVWAITVRHARSRSQRARRNPIRTQRGRR